MKIGITCYPTYGGSGIVATELGMELAARGHEVHFITYANPIRLDPGDAAHPLPRGRSLQLSALPIPALLPGAGLAHGRGRRSYDLDLLHVHYAIPHSISAMLAQQMLAAHAPPALHHHPPRHRHHPGRSSIPPIFPSPNSPSSSPTASPAISRTPRATDPRSLRHSNAFKPGGTLNRYFGGTMEQLKWGEPLYTLLYAVGIIFFAYFYVSIVFNPSDVADNMRKYGGFIPGIRPGHRTRDYINDVLTRVTLVGGLYLILISLIPEWMIAGIHLDHIPWIGPRVFSGLPTWVLHGLNVNFYFGGTSLLIVVGVAMDTVNQIESQLVMRHYEGFTSRSGRVRGKSRWG